jgi:multiple sugar transport system permease protein
MQDMMAMVKETGKRRGRMTGRGRREARDFYVMIMPWLLGFIFLSLTPLLLGLATSFTNYNGLNLANIKFVGLANYKRAIDPANKDFWISLKNTFLYMIVVVPVGQALAIGLAAVMNQRIKGKYFFRLIYYIPSILPLAAAAQAWSMMWNKNSGLVNALLSLFRPGTAVNWIGDHFILMLLLYVWWQVGGGMVIYLAGLQGIPEELKEAAKIDGANRFQAFRHVTLPLLTPVIFFQSILGIIGALQVLQVPILIYGRAGLSGNVQIPQKYYMYMIYVYSQTFDFQRYGLGVALSWIFFLIILVLTLVMLYTSRFWVYYEVSQEGGNRT